MSSSLTASQTDSIQQVILTVGGRATRLLPATKQQPKSMLPLYTRAKNGELLVSPVLQRIYEGLFDLGVREFYFVVGKSKRAVQDHFNVDMDYVQLLTEQDRTTQAYELMEFYRRLSESFLVWVNQPEPRGFGDAVLSAEGLVGTEPFLVHAGDTYIISESQVFQRLFSAHLGLKAQATLTLMEVPDPRRFGVAETVDNRDGTLTVTRVVEKPQEPTSNLAIMALYAFDSQIMKALKQVEPGKNGEIQLTDGVQKLIDSGLKVQAIKMAHNDYVLDIGTPESYWDALELSHRYPATKKTIGG